MDKRSTYETLVKQATSVLQDETNQLANMSNLVSIIHHGFNFWWTGFYFVESEELVLGPFQGPVACTRIGYGKGVCGTCWETQSPQVVGNVHEFEGHIACSAESNSEVVIPILQNGKTIGVLDVDSTTFDQFDEVDVEYLTKLVHLIWQ
ncbi:MAG: GAF domain-containing protein [Bacteroidia bacterium]|nr:GAF domain-containing protein [Bacteroidia bacterium]